jgi:transcriptional regulator with XRE-family HTH domain
MIKILTKRRKQNGIKQHEIAKHIGVNFTTMSRYESGKRKIPFDLIEKYADYLGYDIFLVGKSDYIKL